jgi:hypothetical protein
LSSAVPGRHTRRCTLLAAVSLPAVLAPVPFWPEGSAALARRFFRPWDVPPAGSSSTLAVTPGYAFAARGRPLSVAARFQPGADRLPSPTAALVADIGGKEVRQAMGPDGTGAFTVLRQVRGDFLYWVEGGSLASDWFSVTLRSP